MSHFLPIVILIPSHNRNALLERTLDSVLDCASPENRDVRLIIVENGGRFGAEKIVASKQSWIKPEYMFYEKGNKSQALNYVIDKLEDALLLFLDDDLRVDKFLLVHYSNAVAGNSEGIFYGGGMLVDYEQIPPVWLLDYLPFSAKGWHPDQHKFIADGMAFMGCNWAAFSNDIKKAGGFDPQFGPGSLLGGTGQEADMQRRLIEKGISTCYIKDALVWHYVPKARCSSEWALKRNFRNSVTKGFSMKNINPQRSVGGVPYWMIITTAKSGFNVITACIKSWLKNDPVILHQAQDVFVCNLGRIKGLRNRRSVARL